MRLVNALLSPLPTLAPKLVVPSDAVVVMARPLLPVAPVIFFSNVIEVPWSETVETVLSIVTSSLYF